MNVELRDRTELHVRIYFEKTRDPEIRTMLPQKAMTIEEAVNDFRDALKADASSYGKTIYADDMYVGDIWCFGIAPESKPGAMISYCLFEKTMWNHGIVTKALNCFLKEIQVKFNLKSVGAFTFFDNIASVVVLQKNGFDVLERFSKDGVESVYLQKNL